jgi:peptidoglycan/xylan/chitin deacetylase (PgdA/CDA1 family)
VPALLIAAAAASADVSPLVRGAQLLTQARPQAALREFTAAVEEDPECAEARVGLGAAHLHLGRTTQALECFNQALELNKTSRPARLGVASALFLDGLYDQALPQYRYCLAFECSERSAVRAAAAESACLLGLYEAAEAEASLAVQEDPACELARIVAGAAWLARGDATKAVALLQEQALPGVDDQPLPRSALTAPSPLFSPRAHYFVTRRLRDEERLAFLGRGAASGAAMLPPIGEEMDAGPAVPDLPETVAEGFAIARPRPGTVVEGTTSVVLEGLEDLAIAYVALLVDDEFRSMTNAAPFRLSMDADRLAPGPHQIRVDGYGPSGERVGTAAVLVTVGASRERTLSYEEQAARRSVGVQLERLLVVRAPAGGRSQLLGHALRELGRLDEAVQAFEEAFCAQPTAPGVRADLLTAYRDQGLQVGAASREIHTATGGQQVCLTFDDGPHPLITPRVLDLLDQYSVKATFFLVGKQVELYPQLAAEVVARGHEVGSHSYSHSNLRRFPKVYVERELVKSRAAIRRATGRTVALFRPPGGNYDQDVRDAAAETGYTTVFWTSNIGNCPGWTPEATAEKFMAELTNGGLVLLHNGEDGSLEALTPLLNALARDRRLVGTVGSLPELPFSLDPLAGY